MFVTDFQYMIESHIISSVDHAIHIDHKYCQQSEGHQLRNCFHFPWLIDGFEMLVNVITFAEDLKSYFNLSLT